MRSRSTACVAVLLVWGFLISAQAHTEAPQKLPEPWAGNRWLSLTSPGRNLNSRQY